MSGSSAESGRCKAFPHFVPSAPPIKIHCAFNHKNAPLSYGLLLTYARERFPEGQFDFSFNIVDSTEAIARELSGHERNILLCSDYLWTVKDYLAFSRYAKEFDPSCIVIHGGPCTPKYPEVCERFLRENPCVDYAVREEGEESLVELLQHIWSGTAVTDNVAGVSCLVNGEYFHAPDRAHLANLDMSPSPYLEGMFDDLDFSQYDMVIETNRGCMYRCSFCDWLRSKLRLKSMETVKKEIEWAAQYKMKTLYMIDANFGMLKRDFEIVDHLCEMKVKYGYPKSLILTFAKNATKDLVQIIEKLIDHDFHTLACLSLQTMDKPTLEIIGRKNIDPDELEKTAEVFSRKGIILHYQFMLGLPGQTLDAFLNDLERCFDKKGGLYAFRTVVTPNAPMAEPSEMEKHRVEVDESNVVTSTATMPKEEMQEAMSVVALLYMVHPYVWNMLYYPLQYLRKQTGLPVTGILRKLSRDLRSGGNDYRFLKSIAEDSSYHMSQSTIAIYKRMYTHGMWKPLMMEFWDWVRKTYSHNIDMGLFNAVVQYQGEVLPCKGREFPRTISINYNVPALMEDLEQGKVLGRGAYRVAECTIQEAAYPLDKRNREIVASPE